MLKHSKLVDVLLDNHLTKSLFNFCFLAFACLLEFVEGPTEAPVDSACPTNFAFVVGAGIVASVLLVL